MKRKMRETLKFYDEPNEEVLADGRYILRYQAVDDRKA